MLSVGEAFRKMPSITEVMLWPPTSKTWWGSGHTEHILLQCFGQSSGPWTVGRKAASLREEKVTGTQLPASPWSTLQLWWSAASAGANLAVFSFYGLSELWAAGWCWPSQQHHLPTADFSKTLSECPRREQRRGLTPLFICKPFCFEEQWHFRCTHGVHSSGTLRGGGETQLGSWRSARGVICPSLFQSVSLSLSWL